MTPLAELIADLNAFQPVVLGGYPSALVTLARAQQDGRLCIHPVMISAAGESLPSVTRRLLGAAFGCRVGNYYGSSEAVGLTFECREDRLHVNSDWYIVEPVDEHNRTVPAGQLSEGVLVTNLANRIQPIIRYQLGDRVTVDPEPCPCGSPFPTIDVVGRTDDTLTFTTPDGGQVEILPLAVATVAEEAAGVVGCQLIQRAPTALSVRLRVEPPEEQDAVWPVLKDLLAAFLSEHGATAVTIDKDDEPPALNPRSGKYRQVYVDIAETA